MAVTVIGLFCEDIREEKAGTNTIVGIMPDNLHVTKIPGVLHKLALYVRINIDPTAQPVPISITLKMPDGSVMPLGEITSEFVSKACIEAQQSGAPVAGILSRVVFGTLPIQMPGRIVATAKVGADELFCATLNIDAADVSQE